MADSDLLLVSDVGGTNTTVALVHHAGGRFAIQTARRFASGSLAGIEEALERFLMDHGDQARPSRYCVSAAGPVVGRVCDMTNVAWRIDADAVSERLGIPTFLINDFTAICYALPLLDTHEQISAPPLAHPGDRYPAGYGTVRAVVGAGTGLGVGFLTEDHGHFTAHPSEGGHAEFAPYDATTAELKAFIDGRLGPNQGTEQFLSGQGISNAFHFFLSERRLPRDAVVEHIEASADLEKPRLISEAAPSHAGLAAVMRMFVTTYAHFAMSACTFYLPTAGLYLAGGIAAKNVQWFTDGDLFTSTLEKNYNPRVARVLREIPVHLIADYDISLYGAAHAAVSLDVQDTPP
jgi:glucokinase